MTTQHNTLLKLGVFLVVLSSCALAQPETSMQKTETETPAFALIISAEQDVAAANYKAATAKLNQAREIAVEPEDKGYLAYLSSKVALLQDKPQEARAILDKALIDLTIPGYTKPRLYTNYGDSYLQQGDYALARQAYSKILDDKIIFSPKVKWYNKISAWDDRLGATSKIAVAYAKEGNAEAARQTLQDFKATTKGVVQLFNVDSELAKLEADFINEDQGIVKYRQLFEFKVLSGDSRDFKIVEEYKDFARLDLAALYVKRKDVASARALYDQVLKSTFSDSDTKALAQEELAKLG